MKFNALLLLELFEGKEVPTAVHNIEKQIVSMNVGPEVHQSSESSQGKRLTEVVEATLAFGQSCPLEHSFPSALQVLLEAFR